MLGFLESPKPRPSLPIDNLNKVIHTREIMIEGILSVRTFKTDTAYDKAYFNLQKKSFKALKKHYEKLGGVKL